jgi:uncharacterized protein YneF (UPF0154 family)
MIDIISVIVATVVGYALGVHHTRRVMREVLARLTEGGRDGR